MNQTNAPEPTCQLCGNTKEFHDDREPCWDPRCGGCSCPGFTCEGRMRTVNN